MSQPPQGPSAASTRARAGGDVDHAAQTGAWLALRGAARAELHLSFSGAALGRAVRVAVIMPALFALSLEVLGNLQLATYAAFGAIATLVLANFGGGRVRRLRAHIGLTVAGAVFIVIGTAVQPVEALAVVTVLVVTAVVLFAGVLGPNVAGGGSAVLVALVLPATTPASLSEVGYSVAGWCLACVVGAAACLVTRDRGALDMRTTAASCAEAAAAHIQAVVRRIGTGTASGPAQALSPPDEVLATLGALRAQATAAAARPYTIAGSGQAFGQVVELLGWITGLLADICADPAATSCSAADRQLLVASEEGLRAAAGLLRGEGDRVSVNALAEAREGAGREMRSMRPEHTAAYADRIRVWSRLRSLSVAAEVLVLESLAVLRAPGTAIGTWQRGEPAASAQLPLVPEPAPLTSVLAAHCALHSAWFRNSIRGAVALALAVLVADQLAVEHAFWVVLGSLSVLRSNALGTGATALRAVLGTVLGVIIGSLVVLAVGASSTALWIALPLVVLVAGYAPAALSFTLSQAAFSALVLALFDLLGSTGLATGIVRLENVAIGCAVSVAIGLLFWPRGASGVLADTLCQGYGDGADLLEAEVRQAVRPADPAPAPDATRADDLLVNDALRVYLNEQGAKRISVEHLWRLVGGTVRLRLVAVQLTAAGLPPALPPAVGQALEEQARLVGSWYRALGSALDAPAGRADTMPDLPLPPHLPSGPAEPRAQLESTDERRSLLYALWIHQHLADLTRHLPDLCRPAQEVAALRRRPWWR